MMRALLSVCSCIAAIVSPATTLAADAADHPSLRLHGADLYEARRVAVESALSSGWSMSLTSQGVVLFEQATDPSDGPGSSLVRVRADFLTDQDDLIIRLQAIQIDAAGTSAEHATDVTERYRDNLMNALWSLRAKWEARLTVADPAPVERGTESHAGSVERPIGTWAYYAERFAQDQGCHLAEGGAELLSAGVETELHRVQCQGRGALLIHCQFGECTMAR
ncbi:hypothetical protein ABC977_08675 [Thioalkalicoccus limnaeus]|uniref:Uncharacterized protein n=1 Tax=Thioalkalicoccus limnaeus TaxID=120681 RepID=A0ABV4BD74_9GAMM